MATSCSIPARTSGQGVAALIFLNNPHGYNGDRTMKNRTRISSLIAAGLSLLLTPSIGTAQAAYPNKPIRLVDRKSVV